MFLSVCGDNSLWWVSAALRISVSKVSVHALSMANRLWPAALVYGRLALPAFQLYFGAASKEVAALQGADVWNVGTNHQSLVEAFTSSHTSRIV